MQVYNNEHINVSPCVLALGSFDTVHIGHQKLLEMAKKYALEKGIAFGVYMFERRPAHILQSTLQHDTYSVTQREKIIERLGAEFVYYENFNKDFMRKSPEEFLRYLKDKLCARAVVAGFNYRFGCAASGDSDTLKRLCSELEMDAFVVPAVCDADGIVSSTRIRSLLAVGDVQAANVLLGRVFALEGSVRKDRGVGHAMGVPTANLELDPVILLPKDGVYMTVAVVDGIEYPAVTNIGIRPTFGLDKRTVETHLLDYDGDLYGKDIQLKFYSHLRDEQTFSSVDALMKQISEDKKLARAMFSKINLEKIKI